MARFIFSMILSLALTFFISCSSNRNPVQPFESTESSKQFSTLPVGVSECFSDGSPAGGVGTLGIFNLHIDTKKLTAELSPLRTSSLTDVLEVVDITNFLQLAPCTDCAKIKSVSLDANGNLILSIGIKHPFGVGDPLKPITGRNRADLHVFNVEGVVLSDSTGINFNGIGKSIADFRLINADGYSAYLDEQLENIFPTPASIHPYILHFDDYSSGNFSPSNPMGFESVTIPPPSGYLVMAMGCDYDYQDYIFKLQPGSSNFIFAIECTYAVSAASKIKRFSPEYRIPQHNKKSASEVKVKIVNNQLKAKTETSTAQLEIHVVDISHGVPVGSNLNEMLADSSVGAIKLEIPGILTAPVTVNTSSPSGSGHSPSDPLIYSVTINNSAKGDIGTYTGLVKVLDTYSPGLNTSPLLNSMDGIKRVEPIENPLTGLFQISEFATYAVFEIPIEIQNEPPVAVLKPTDAEIVIGQTITWDATASHDPDGTIVQYEWDFDLPNGDPANFAPDAITTPPVGIKVSNPYTTEGTFYAAVRVTDNFNDTDIDIVSFSVSAFIPTYWSQYMHDKSHGGRTNVTGPQTNNIAWTFDGLGSNPLTVIEGYDGTIYYGSVSFGGIYAINPNGTQKWLYTPSLNVSYSKPLGITSDNAILYVGINYSSFDGRITGVNTTNGQELWMFNETVSANTYGLVLDNDDLVVAGTQGGASNYNLIRITRNGTQVWNKPTGWNWCTAPAQGPDGTIYTKSSMSILAVNPNTGATIGSYTYPSDNMQTSIAVRSDGSIVFGTNQMVYCLSPSMNLLWQCECAGGILIDGFGIGPNDEVYANRSGMLYAISPSGVLQWTYSGTAGWTAPIVDANGTIYIGRTNGVAAINPNGTTKWVATGTTGSTSPIIAHDGSLYINTSGAILMKIKDP